MVWTSARKWPKTVAYGVELLFSAGIRHRHISKEGRSDDINAIIAHHANGHREDQPKVGKNGKSFMSFVKEKTTNMWSTCEQSSFCGLLPFGILDSGLRVSSIKWHPCMLDSLQLLIQHGSRISPPAQWGRCLHFLVFCFSV